MKTPFTGLLNLVRGYLFQKPVFQTLPVRFSLLLATLLYGSFALNAQEQYAPNAPAIPKQYNIQLPFARTAQRLNVDVINNMVILEGDIILGPLVSFEGDNAVAIDGAQYRWPNSVIPYQITPGHPKTADIQWAINHVNSTTNLCLVARTNQADYIRFVSGGGCSSWVGRQGGAQDIVIGSCSPGSIAHEICHAAGLFHEHTRADRDNFVTINWANITAGKEHNFQKHVADGTDIGSYDYGSIMHYGTHGFSKNGQPTISIKMPPGNAGTVIGQRNGLSPKDIAGINNLYGPGPCKSGNCGNEDCLGFNPATLAVQPFGNQWRVVSGNSAMFLAPVKAEADRIVQLLKHLGVNRNCYVGRPDPSFQYSLVNGAASNAPMLPGEDCLSFNPANLKIQTIGGRIKITDNNSILFDFNTSMQEAQMTLCLIKKYGFTKTCYVGRPDPSFQYMRK
jgi:hypothetical protein